MPKESFSRPRRGCGCRKVVNALISGYHSESDLAKLSGLKLNSISNLVCRTIPDEYGLDVMCFRSSGKKTLYRIVGIMKWDGGYYDLTGKKYSRM